MTGACAGWLALCVLAACTSTPPALPPPRVAADPRPDQHAPEAGDARTVPLPSRSQDEDLPPAILLPRFPAEDAELAHAGALAIRKSHVADRFLDSDPTRAKRMIDLMVADALIAEESARHGIRVEKAHVQRLADQEQKQLEAQVARELAGKMSFAEYVERQLALTVPEYRRWLELNLARRLYREYVARYSAMLDDRVQVRFLAVADKKVAEEAARRAREGADFQSLVLKYSEDETRGEGGLLPPFAKGFKHPVAGAAFTLGEGEVSEPIAYERAGALRWYVVYCVKKLARRAVGFRDVKEEIDREIAARPMSAFEFDAFYVQLRGRAESLPSTDGRR